MATSTASYTDDDVKDAPSVWPAYHDDASSAHLPSEFDDAASAYTVEALLPDPLEGFDQPLGIFREYVRDQVTVLEVQEARASLTGCVSFSPCLVHGQTAL